MGAPLERYCRAGGIVLETRTGAGTHGDDLRSALTATHGIVHELDAKNVDLKHAIKFAVVGRTELGWLPIAELAKYNAGLAARRAELLPEPEPDPARERKQPVRREQARKTNGTKVRGWSGAR